MNIKKNQIKQIEHLFSTSSLSKVVKKLHTLEPELELSKLVIKYFKVIHPDYDLSQIKQEFINGIHEKSQDKNNDDTSNQSNTYIPQSNNPNPPIVPNIQKDNPDDSNNNK